MQDLFAKGKRWIVRELFIDKSRLNICRRAPVGTPCRTGVDEQWWMMSIANPSPSPIPLEHAGTPSAVFRPVPDPADSRAFLFRSIVNSRDEPNRMTTVRQLPAQRFLGPSSCLDMFLGNISHAPATAGSSSHIPCSSQEVASIMRYRALTATSVVGGGGLGLRMFRQVSLSDASPGC